MLGPIRPPGKGRVPRGSDSDQIWEPDWPEVATPSSEERAVRRERMKRIAYALGGFVSAFAGLIEVRRGETAAAIALFVVPFMLISILIRSSRRG